MAQIRDTLALQDRFSNVLDRYINKTSAAGKMAQSAASQANSGVTAATQNLIGQMGAYESAAQNAFTDTQRDAALNRLENQMRRIGLVFTTTAGEANRSDLIMRTGLQQLAVQGEITASAEAEESYATKKEGNAHQSIFGKLVQHTKELIKNSAAAAQARQSHDMLGRRLLGVATIMFTARRILRFLTDSLKRAPNGVRKSWHTMTSGIKDELARGFVAMLKAMQPAINRFNAFMNSRAGQRFARGIETAMTLAGQAAGWLLDKVTTLGTWIGDHFSQAMEVAAIGLALYAGNMLVAAAATLVANWPILLIVGGVILLINILNQLGFTSQQIFGGIGAVIGALYAFIHNIIADVWNIIAVFAEFIANVFINPLAAVQNLFYQTFSGILKVVQVVAKAIDKLCNTSLSGAVTGVQTRLDKWGATIPENKIKIPRLQRVGYKSTIKAFSSSGANIGSKFTNVKLDKMSATALKDTAKNTKKTAKHTKNIDKNLSDEQLKYLEDVATGRYERNTNTTLSPNIKVIVQGGSDAKKTGQDIGQAIADVLARQAAYHTTLTTQEV